MAFNINAHVILSGPKNIKAVTKSIQKQLGSVNAKINLQTPKNLSKQLGAFNKGISNLSKSISTLQASATSANTHLSKLGTQFRSLNKSSMQMSKSQSNVQKSLDKTGQAVGEVRNEIQAFGRDAALAIRRFSAFTVATGIVFGFVRAVQGATKAAIDYEREVVKIVQVTGASAAKIKGLNTTIKELSVSLGVDANELAELSRMFAQTGQTIDQVRHSIDAVAKSSLAPTFGKMKDTAEGLIAAMAQFGIAAEKQEAILASLNAVSKKFAVESEDLISVIRRAGGVFAASSKGFEEPIEGLQQLIGIFTAVRSTTRESADTIAVGLRTIFTRIQRRGTIDFLKQFNIELVDAKGNFIGLFPAFQELSRGLDKIIKSGNALTLSAITEELGGVRQVGKLIPAITQFNKALEATKIAGQAAKEGLGKDVALALQPLGKQFEMLQQRFNALIRDITQSKSFQNMAKVALSLGNAFLTIADTLRPLLPMLTTFAAIKISKGLFEFGKGFVGGLSKGGGAGGMGDDLGGAVTGGGGGGGGSGSRSIAVQQALNTALKNNSTLLNNNNTALKQLGNQVVSNTTAINNVSGKVTPVIGAMGNLITALNRSSLGGGFGGGFGGGRRGRPRKFARGGYVSGPSHSQGGVPAILEGGEYVIPKGYRGGGNVWRQRQEGMSTKEILASAKKQGAGGSGRGRRGFAVATKKKPLQFSVRDGRIGGFFLEENEGNDPRTWGFDSAKFMLKGKLAKATGQGSQVPAELKAGKMAGFFPSKTDIKKGSLHDVVKKYASKALTRAVKGIAEEVRSQKIVDIGGVINADEQAMADHAARRLGADGNAVNSVAGFLNEGVIQALTGAQLAGEGTNFDFPNAALRGNKKRLGDLFGAPSAITNLVKADAKASWGLRKGIKTKIINDINDGNLAGVLMEKAAKQSAGATDRANVATGRRVMRRRGMGFAAGGNVFSPQGTDTVPAMLTPGEFVINRKSAEKFGYGNLKKINQYAKGGRVQYLQGGGRMKIDEAIYENLGNLPKGFDTHQTQYQKVQRESPRAADVVDAASIDAYEKALDKGATVLEALIAAESVFVTSVEDAGSILKEHNATVEESTAALEIAKADASKAPLKGRAKAQAAQTAAQGGGTNSGGLNIPMSMAADVGTESTPGASEQEALGAAQQAYTDALKTATDTTDKSSESQVTLKTQTEKYNERLAKTGEIQGKTDITTGNIVGQVKATKTAATTPKSKRKIDTRSAALKAFEDTGELGPGTGPGHKTHRSAVPLGDGPRSVTKAIQVSKEHAAERITAKEAKKPKPVDVKVVEEAADKSAQAVSGWGNAVAGSIGAIGGFTAAISSMDFSSPEAALSSLMALSFAVTQAQTAFAGFAAITKAAAASEAAETGANVQSTASELAETAANIKSAAVTGFKDQMGLMTGNLK